MFLGILIAAASFGLGFLVFLAAAHHPTGGDKSMNGAFLLAVFGFVVGIAITILGAVTGH